MALDPESRLVLAVVPGARDAEAVEEVVGEVKERTGGRVLDLATSDDYPAYETALLNAYGQEVTTTATGRPSRKMVPDKVPPAGMNYATVEKRREKGRVVEIVTRVVFGTMAAVQAVLAKSKASRRINTSFLERQNATDRHHNARKVRKTYTFSKDWRVHEAMTYFTMYSYNFCWPVRTLNERDDARALAAKDAGDGGGAGRSRLDDARMDHDARRSTALRHHRVRPRFRSNNPKLPTRSALIPGHRPRGLPAAECIFSAFSAVARPLRKTRSASSYLAGHHQDAAQ